MRHSLSSIVFAVAVNGAVTIAGPLARVPVACAQPVRAGVLLPRLSPSLEPIRSDIERAVTSGAALAGVTVKGPERVREATAGHGELVSCITVTCALEMARLLDAGIVVSTEIENAKRSFTVRVTVVQAPDGREMGQETATCKSTEPCAPIPDTARDVAREAVRKALDQVRVDQQVAASRLHQAEPGVGASKGAGAGTNASAAGAGGAVGNSSDRLASAGAGTTADAAEPTRTPAVGGTAIRTNVTGAGGRGTAGPSSAWPWVAFVGAGAAIAAGVYTLTKIDGSQTDCTVASGGKICRETRDAAVEGWSLIGLGAIAAGAGLYLYFGRDRDGGGSPTVTVGLQGVQLKGAF